MDWHNTQSAGEDSAAAGWSIDNSYYRRSATATGAFTESAGSSLMLRINGVAGDLPAAQALVSNTDSDIAAGNEWEVVEKRSDGFVYPRMRITTGSNPGGYTITGLRVRTVFPAASHQWNQPVVKVFPATGQGVGDINRNGLLGQLTAPSIPTGILTVQTVAFNTSTRIDLAANTGYWLVFEAGGNGRIHLGNQISGAEENGCPDFGWQLSDYNQVDFDNGFRTGSYSAEPLTITISGYLLSTEGQIVAAPRQSC